MFEDRQALTKQLLCLFVPFDVVIEGSKIVQSDSQQRMRVAQPALGQFQRTPIRILGLAELPSYLVNAPQITQYLPWIDILFAGRRELKLARSKKTTLRFAHLSFMEMNDTETV